MGKKVAKPGSGKSSEKPWIALMNRARDLQQAGRANLHERVTILVQVFENVDWREEQYSRGVAHDDEAVAALLNEYVEDSHHEFLQLRAVLQRFPNASDWAACPVSRLLAEALAPGRDKQAPPTKRKTATLADLNAAKIRAKEAETKAARSRADCETARTQVETAREAIARLERELAAARSRVAELEEENDRLRTQLVQPETALAGAFPA
jgi:hypothetical protein